MPREPPNRQTARVSTTNGSGPAQPPDARSEDDVPRGGLILRSLAVVGVFSTLALFGFLIVFAIVGGETRNPDEIDQIGFTDRAEAICVEHQQLILALPPASQIETPTQRADVLDDANVVLADMVAALRVEVDGRDVVDDLPDARSDSLSPADQAIVDAGTLSAKDADNIDRWLTDYEVYVADREAHSERLRTEGDVRILISGKDSAPITEFIDGYARVNDMESCTVPQDVG